ncbi:MAG: ribosome maturation factor RimM [Bacteroidia bacterium]|nr:ribosome maturation factor RimM [Bacteroidia bacterium]MDW8158828.1 ribosome maturation factor RimM [Bacteroidia bacterium]
MLDDFFLLGKITKAHGLKGEVKAFFDVDDYTSFLQLREVYVQYNNQALRKLCIQRLRHLGALNFLLKFESLDTLDSVEYLIGQSLFLPISLLPPLSEEEFYYHEVIGFEVVDSKFGKLGIVKEIIPMPAQDLLCVRCGEKEILIPITHSFVPRVDRNSKLLYTVLPEGLLEVFEVYLGDIAS